MKSLPNIDLIKDTLKDTKKAIILLSATPNFDLTAAALSWSLMLTGHGIDTQVVCGADMRVEFSRLVGVDKVQKKVGNRNLIISFDYQEDQVEKVSYQISPDGKRFNLVIAPKSGVRPLQPETVNYEFAGADAQTIFLFGINSFEELGDTYEKERLLFDNALTVGLALYPQTPFAKCHLDAGGYSCLCELIPDLAQNLGLKLDVDSSTNLLFGLSQATQGFAGVNATADTFETIATLMRAGAVRQATASIPMMTPAQMPFIPTSPSRVEQPVIQADTNQFARMLGGTSVV